MEEIELVKNENGIGKLNTYFVGRKSASMDIQISGTTLIAGHIEVEEAFRGTGLAKKLFDYVISYARNNNLKVQPDCPFVYTQFNNNPHLYDDIRFHKE